MGYSIAPITENCYPGTTVLINKLDIRDEAILNQAEALATYINIAKLEGEAKRTRWKRTNRAADRDLVQKNWESILSIDSQFFDVLITQNNNLI